MEESEHDDVSTETQRSWSPSPADARAGPDPGATSPHAGRRPAGDAGRSRVLVVDLEHFAVTFVDLTDSDVIARAWS